MAIIAGGDRPLRKIGRFRMLVVVLLYAAASALVPHASAEEPVRIVLAKSIATLSGPWLFHLGDNPAWSSPRFDDSGWERMDLSSPSGAHDGDVGLTGYVPGWSARGHRSVDGFAWYRMHVDVASAPAQALAIDGPAAVDSAYQLYFNGRLIGQDGGFTGRTPKVFSIQPRYFPLTQEAVSAGGHIEAVIAVRVWMGPWNLSDPQGGGMRIAPALGNADAVRLRFHEHWAETIRGYIVEVLEAFMFVFLTGMTWLLGRLEETRRYQWLCLAMLLTAAYRANQAVFFWGQFETVQAFELISVTLLVPLCLGGWTMSWVELGLASRRQLVETIIAVLTGVYILVQFFSRSWFNGLLPQFWFHIAKLLVSSVRLGLLGLVLLCAYGALRNGKHRSLAFFSLLPFSIGQFSQELSAIGVRSIWFPFGTGVSRTQFAYALAGVILLVMLMRRISRVRPVNC